MFCSVVGGYRVDDHEADIVAGNRNGQLVVEDMVLGFQVHRVDGEDVIQCRGAVFREVRKVWMILQEL